MSGECELYEDLLVQEALGETGEKEKLFLKRHLDSCPACRAGLAAIMDSMNVLKREQPVEVPAGLAERTLHRIERMGERFTAAASPYRETALMKPGTWSVRGSLVGWMVAASVLVMAVATLVPGVWTGQEQNIRACQEHIRVLATALRQYATDHNGVFPQGPEWYRALDYDYLHRTGALLCPSRIAVGRPSEKTTDYIYNPARTSINEPSDYPLLWDAKGAHEVNGRHVLYVDGRVDWVPEEEFEMTLARYRIDESAALE